MKNWFSAALAATVLASASCDKVREMAASAVKKQSAKTASAPSEIVRDLDTVQFKPFITQPGKLVVVDFHAQWCGPCKQLSPILERVVREKEGTVVLGKIDVDQAKALAAAQRVSSIPDVRLFRDGEQVDQFIGMIGEAEMREKIDRHSAGLEVSEAPATAASGGTAPAANSAEPPIQPMKKDWLPPGVQRR